MNYELALKLKNAGFPQQIGVFGLSHYYVGNNRIGYATTSGRMDELFNTDDLNKDWYKIPTLSELIEACGDEGDKPTFKSLSLHSLRPNSEFVQAPEGLVNMKEMGRWCARARMGIKVTDSKQWEKKVAWGSTPEEAVANLYIALQKK